jgi:hypothetical protein
MATQENDLYTLFPLDDFKALAGVDGREDKTARFCLVTATLTIEQHCKRRLIRKKHFERLEYIGDLRLPLREYPVTEILSVSVIVNEGVLEPDLYNVIPGCGLDVDIPFELALSPALNRYSPFSAVKAVYWAGYPYGKIPADLAAACFELAAWNMNRYRGKRVGMTGNIRGAGKEGEHFEMSMPENVRNLLEPYRRKII